MKINWKVRLKNPQFLFQIYLAIAVPIMAYNGISEKEVTSWYKLYELALEAISNPYIVFTVLVGIYNATVDNTTPGINDSSRVLSYESTKDSKDNAVG